MNQTDNNVINVMAERYSMDPVAFSKTCKSICFPDGKATDEQFLAFLAVAKAHELNPFTREIFAFPRPNQGIQAIVSVDGWMKIINSHPQFDGMEFIDRLDAQGKLISITCRMYRKDRRHPMEATEYMRECQRPTEPWRQWPARLLRHKAAIQAARYTFGFAGIVDPDESQRIIESKTDVQIEKDLETVLDKVGEELPRSSREEAPEPEVVIAELVDDEPIGSKVVDELFNRLAVSKGANAVTIFVAAAKQMGFSDFTTIPKSRQAEFEKKLQGA